MWNKIKDQKYLVIIKYIILGIILAVIVFQFITDAIRNQEVDINSLYGKDTLKYIVSSLVGGIAGGIVFILMTINKADRQTKEQKLWEKLKEKPIQFYIRNIAAFSIGGFAYQIVTNLFSITNYSNSIQTLFSTDYIIDYVGIFVAMAVFSIFISIGIKKRLYLLFGA